MRRSRAVQTLDCRAEAIRIILQFVKVLKFHLCKRIEWAEWFLYLCCFLSSEGQCFFLEMQTCYVYTFIIII
jgi:hypothetical protein